MTPSLKSLLAQLEEWWKHGSHNLQRLRELKEQVVLHCGLEPAEIDRLPNDQMDAFGLYLALLDHLKDALDEEIVKTC